MHACVYLRMRAAERVGFWGSLVMIGVSWRCADLGGIFHHRSTGPRGARFFPRVLFVLADQPTLTPNVDLATIVVSMKFFTDAIKSGLYAVG